MGEEKIIKSSKKSNNCCCHTRLHFTKENICIQNLKPNHYEEDLLEDVKTPQSDFVKSIIDSRFPIKENERQFIKISDCDFGKILKDITNDLSLK